MPEPARSFSVLARHGAIAVGVATVATPLLVLPGQVTAWQLADDRTHRDILATTTLGGALTLAVGAIVALVWLVAGVLFLRWLLWARANLDRDTGAAVRFPRDWVVASWLLPVVNLVLPPVLVHAVARASGVRRAGLLVWSWWVACLAWLAALGVWSQWDQWHSGPSAYFGWLSSEVDPEFREQVIAFHRPPYAVAVPAFAVLAVAAVLAVRMVRAVTAAQTQDGELDAPPPAPFVPLRRLARLATAAVVVVTVTLLSPAVWAALAPSEPAETPALSYQPDIEYESPDDNTVSPEVHVAVAVSVVGGDPVPYVFVGGVLVGCGAVVFLWWLARARSNLAAIPDAAPRFGPGWVIGAWFVPMAGLVLGPMVVGDVARESHPSAAGSGESVTTPARYEAVRLVWAWTVVSLAVPITYPPLWAVLPLRSPTVGWLPATVVLVLAALLAIALIRRITTAQHRQMAASSPPVTGSG